MPHEERINKTKTVCTYCGVGCGFPMFGLRIARNSRIVPLLGDANQISTCVKGKFGWDYVNHPDRLQKPLIREETGFREAKLGRGPESGHDEADQHQAAIWPGLRLP